ncbi:Haloalkane dehalogenase [Fusarium albosuccineum]|uniref:Haloalkane dehalogenase n=1 Tax=Fusarium albosuccineum TaxID=1237068 RepID=A0A8H4LI42_9HYPO|nr:Haloalkane dehalogenase [Fusarium albosuccineum]
MTDKSFTYTELPPRARPVAELKPAPEEIAKRLVEFGSLKPRQPDSDGSVEHIGGASFTHHFAQAPGDYDTVKFHYVTCGEKEQQSKKVPAVFLHGIPDSWFEWHQHMAALAQDGYFCIAPDLKGYGQSSKEPGDYRNEGAAEQLAAMLHEIGVDKFYLVSHDRGSVQADCIAALYPDRVVGYIRGEQHLIHYNPALSTQHALFLNAPYNGIMSDPQRLAVTSYKWLTVRQVPDEAETLQRVAQELAYEGVDKAVPRYYGANTFHQEWLDRRKRLMASWRSPIVILQGYDSPTQPREWFDLEEIRGLVPNAKVLDVKFIPGGHFWPLESPAETTAAFREALKVLEGA